MTVALLEGVNMRYAMFVFVLSGAGVLGFYGGVALDPPKASPPHDATVAGAASSFVEVFTGGGGGGSGVVIGPRTVLTAAHVVDGVTWVDVRRTSSSGGTTTSTRGRVVAVDCCDDVAAIQTRDPVGPAATIYHGPLVVGEPCVYVGAPHGFHRSVTVTTINDPCRTIDGREYIVANGNATYGSSGGPMFVRRGERWLLVGVCSRFAFGPFFRSPISFVDVREYGTQAFPRFQGAWE